MSLVIAVLGDLGPRFRGGQVSKRELNRTLRAAGFRQERRPADGDRWVRSCPRGQEVLSIDVVRGGAWRVLLGVGSPPSVWPAVANPDPSRSWVEAESPWWEYFPDDEPDEPLDPHLMTKEAALRALADWVLTTGINWLSDPERLTVSEWRERHNLLMRDGRADPPTAAAGTLA